ncbi:MAG TPA: alkaline phosphatase D family protein [Nocardioidaceae bacterium]|nr:alkaline phosphatase D family protein [Nocardioidaceae bacterium]
MPAQPTRRSLLKAGGAGVTGLVLGSGSAARPALASEAPPDPFTLGVASGDPTPDGVLLWTRLAPAPLTPDGGMPAHDVRVLWQVATDERFTDVVRAGSVAATAQWAHSVHVEVTGLLPDRVYYYRFRVGTQLSPVGRTRTFPAVGTAMQSLSFAAVSCQSFPNGRYAAYRHLAATELDLVVHLGDYIYEDAGSASPAAGKDRAHLPFKVVTTLEDYRIRHAQYHLDPDLQAAHAAAPFLCVPDDHEVVNNMAGDYGANGNSTPEVFLPRRAAAYQAYYEHLPLRRSAMPSGPSMQLYRRLEYGDLASLTLLDTRQYRTPQVDGPAFQPNGPEAYDPSRTLTGPAQERWLLDGLASSSSRWNVVAQQVYMAAIDLAPGPGEAFNTDKWDGYPAARGRITRFLRDARPRNPVVLSGDVHAAMVNDVTVDNAPDGEVVATELLGSSVTSAKGNNAQFEAALPENPQVRYYNGRQRGYLSCTVTPDTWTADLWFVDDVRRADSPVRRGASYVVRDGALGALPA